MSAPDVDGAAAAAAAAFPGAAAGAGRPPVPAPFAFALAAAAAAGVPAGSVFVKRSDDAHARFAEVDIFEADTVTRLAKRASLELNWRTTPDYVELFLVKPAGDEHAFTTPTQAQIDAVLANASSRGEGMPLSLAGITSGAWVVARLSGPPGNGGGSGAGSGGGGGGGGSGGGGGGGGAGVAVGADAGAAIASQWTSNRLRTSLVEAGIAVDESFVRRVIGSSALQNALAFCSSSSDVSAFHELAMRDPQSETRAAVFGESGVSIIDGDIYFPHRTTALFKWAFDGAAPCVLKLPQNVGAARRECGLYNAVGPAAREAGVHLVPVRLLRLSGSHRVGADVTVLREGVLMPPYPVTLAQAPASVIKDHGERIMARLEAAIDFLCVHGWVHGDVKPSNIFLAGDGEPWLGDFGSSFALVSAATAFSGGTPSFQVEGVAPDTPDAAFDRAALVVSLVHAAGLLEAGSRDALPWPASAVRSAISGLAGHDGLVAALSRSLGRALSAVR